MSTFYLNTFILANPPDFPGGLQIFSTLSLCPPGSPFLLYVSQFIIIIISLNLFLTQ